MKINGYGLSTRVDMFNLIELVPQITVTSRDANAIYASKHKQDSHASTY